LKSAYKLFITIMMFAGQYDSHISWLKPVMDLPCALANHT